MLTIKVDFAIIGYKGDQPLPAFATIGEEADRMLSATDDSGRLCFEAELFHVALNDLIRKAIQGCVHVKLINANVPDAENVMLKQCAEMFTHTQLLVR